MVITRKLSELRVSADAMQSAVSKAGAPALPSESLLALLGMDVEIELTAEELRKASLAVDRECIEQDAMAEIFSFAGYSPSRGPEDEENMEAFEEFQRSYGISLLDLANGNGDECSKLRDEIIERFEHDESQDSADSVVWDLAVQTVLEMQAAKKRCMELGWGEEDISSKRKRYWEISAWLNSSEEHDQDETRAMTEEKDSISETLGPLLYD